MKLTCLRMEQKDETRNIDCLRQKLVKRTEERNKMREMLVSRCGQQNSSLYYEVQEPKSVQCHAEAGTWGRRR